MNEWTVSREVDKIHADAIMQGDELVLHLVPGTVKNEQNVNGVVAVLNHHREWEKRYMALMLLCEEMIAEHYKAYGGKCFCDWCHDVDQIINHWGEEAPARKEEQT